MGLSLLVLVLVINLTNVFSRLININTNNPGSNNDEKAKMEKG